MKSAMPSHTNWTIEQLLRWTTEFLRERGATSPRLDAEVLLAHARGCERIELYTAFGELASDELPNQFSRPGTPTCRRNTGRLPGRLPRILLAAVLRLARCLDPRPETEHLIVTVLDLAKEMSAPIAIADVGTGSGIIGICCTSSFRSHTSGQPISATKHLRSPHATWSVTTHGSSHAAER